ncbi:MAG: transporter [Devosiaceae bacterium]|nr:transporter [Devosiaceae bacterium]
MNGIRSKAQLPRLYGLDFARFLAFAGMVFVNFHVVTGSGTGSALAQGFLGALEGKAAATFVVLAGIGLGFGAARAKPADFRATIFKRALFLLAIGLINALIFPADILHYYAIYFIFGMVLISFSTKILIVIGLLLPFVFVGLTDVFDYDAGWNWVTFDYTGFWTAEGFVRNLMYNGWHPVVPWLSFLVFGMLISRMDLYASRTQNRLVFGGAITLGIAYALSFLFTPFLVGEEVMLASVSPIPPFPLYMVAGVGAAALVIGGCLKLFRREPNMFGMPFIITGKQALTLYIAHIILGMGSLEFLGFLGGQSAEFSIFASSLFILFALV